MSGASETMAVMANREPFSMNSPAPVMNSAAMQPQLEQQMHMAYMNCDGDFRQVGQVESSPSPPPFQSMLPGAIIITHTASDQKRKRGRPKKYGPDGSMNIPLGSPQQPINGAMLHQLQQQNFSPPLVAPEAPLSTQMESLPPMEGSTSPTAKKARGRPRGSRNKAKQHSEALGSAGIRFVPHVLNVNTGEDISAKIMTICQNGPGAVCVLSGNGTISTVTLHQAARSGGTATYEGRFDILSLSGSFMQTEVGGQKSRTGGLSVALGGPNAEVLGGSVAGLLVAASPTRVTLGTFAADGQNEVSRKYVEGFLGQRGSSSPSRGTPSESSGGPLSPANLSSAAYNSNNITPWK